MSSLKLATRPWKQNSFAQWCSVATLGFILTAFVLAAHLAKSFGELENRLKSEQIATVYLTAQTEGASTPADVTDQIRLSLGSAARSVQKVTGEEFLKSIESQYPDLAAEVATLGADLKLITPEYVSVRGNISSEQVTRLKALPGVEAVDLSTERMKPLVQQASSIHLILIAVAVLLLGCFLVILNLLAQVNMNLHRESEALLAQLGGSRFQVRMPAVADLALTGLLAGLLAVFLWAMADTLLLRQVSQLSPILREIPGVRASELILLPLAGLLLGIFQGNLRKIRARV